MTDTDFYKRVHRGFPADWQPCDEELQRLEVVTSNGHMAIAEELHPLSTGGEASCFRGSFILRDTLGRVLTQWSDTEAWMSPQHAATRLRDHLTKTRDTLTALLPEAA